MPAPTSTANQKTAVDDVLSSAAFSSAMLTGWSTTTRSMRLRTSGSYLIESRLMRAETASSAEAACERPLRGRNCEG